MKIKAFIFALFLTFPLLSNVANALTLEDKNQIKSEADVQITNMEQGNLMANFDRMPITLLKNTMNSPEITIPQFKVMVTQVTQPIVSHAKILKITYDLDKGIEGHTPLREYIIFPSQSHVLIDGKLVYMNTTMLAFTDNSHWYVMGLDENYVLPILKKTYPDFGSLVIPKQFSQNTKLITPTVAGSQESVAHPLLGQ